MRCDDTSASNIGPVFWVFAGETLDINDGKTASPPNFESNRFTALFMTQV
jgi:hypothetical protein